MPTKHQSNPACIHLLPHLVLGFGTQGWRPQNRLQMKFGTPTLSIRGDQRDLQPHMAEVWIQDKFAGSFYKVHLWLPKQAERNETKTLPGTSRTSLRQDPSTGHGLIPQLWLSISLPTKLSSAHPPAEPKVLPELH